MGRVKRKGARRLITIGKGGIFFDGPKPLIARRSQRDLSAGPCDQKINLAPSRRVVWRRRSDLSSIYLIRMGLRLVQMLGKKLQADDDVVQLAFCKFSSDGSNCKEPPIPPATANLRRQQSASAATRGAVAQRFSEAAPPKTNRRRVSFLAARGRYVEEVGARAAK